MSLDAAVLAALEAWKALPDDERNGERPFVMGFNAGWEAATEAALYPSRHQFWGAGEADCPREIKAGNGELHTRRCKVCGIDNPRDDRCTQASSGVNP